MVDQPSCQRFPMWPRDSSLEPSFLLGINSLMGEDVFARGAEWSISPALNRKVCGSMPGGR